MFSKQFMARWFGASKSTCDGVRRQLVETFLRDALRDRGIPPAVMKVRCLPGGAANGRGMQVRLIVKDSHPGLARHAAGLQDELRARLERLDPLSTGWIKGISWDFQMAECASRVPQRVPGQPRAAAVGTSSREVLDRLLGAGDQAALQAPAGRVSAFARTQPMELLR